VKHNHYARLAGMIVLSFASMYVLMYSMVHTAGDVYHNVNQVYMAGLMTAPMVLIELALMRSMYQNPRLNLALLVAAAVAGIAFFSGIRQQTAVGDVQFLRSMIPHHSGAILMCKEAQIHNPKIRELCAGIITSQQQEIDQMRSLLRELNGGQ